MTSEWSTIAREAGWVKRHPVELAWVVHLLAGATVVYGGIGPTTQNHIVDGISVVASLLAQLAAGRATLPTGRDGAVLLAGSQVPSRNT